MNVGRTLHVTTRSQWRSWLTKNHDTAGEIWLIYYKKGSGKPRLPYNDAVEEALCFGWIDSTAKPRDKKSWVQRFSPRKNKSGLSEMNKERLRRLIKAGKVTPFGLERIRHHLKEHPTGKPGNSSLKEYVLPPDILAVVKANRKVWRNFAKFPESYKRIRIAWIDGARKRPEQFAKRLRYFITMTEQNKKFGMVQ